MGRGKSGVGSSTGGVSGIPRDTVRVHGEDISGYVIKSQEEGVRVARNAPFQKEQDTDYSLGDKQRNGSYMSHYDSETISMHAESDTGTMIGRGRNATLVRQARTEVSVEHVITGDGTEMFKVDTVITNGERAGLKWTKGRSKLKSGFIYSSRSEARSAARKALEYEVKNGIINRYL